jgi:hypothetical protein
MSGESIRVESGMCARVSTGSIVPLGADAVVQVEDTILLEQKVGIYCRIYAFDAALFIRTVKKCRLTSMWRQLLERIYGNLFIF